MINQCHTADDTYFHTQVIWLPNKVDRVLDKVGLSGYFSNNYLYFSQ